MHSQSGITHWKKKKFGVTDSKATQFLELQLQCCIYATFTRCPYQGRSFIVWHKSGTWSSKCSSRFHSLWVFVSKFEFWIVIILPKFVDTFLWNWYFKQIVSIFYYDKEIFNPIIRVMCAKNYNPLITHE